jgi:integrase
MLDAGLRISEACSIKCKNFDFKTEILPFSRQKKSVKHCAEQYQTGLSSQYLKTNEISIESTFIFPSKLLLIFREKQCGKH